MRAKTAGFAVLACVLAGLSACADRDDDDGPRGGVAGTCTPFATAAAASNDPTGVAGPVVPGGGEAAAFDDCLHRWGYRLAKSEDPAETVASATVAACAPALSRWNQSTLATAPAGPDAAVSLVTGETLGTVADRYDSAQSKALFYVVQARAGNCPLPPVAAAATR